MSVQELKRAVTQLEPDQLEEFMIWAADYHFKQWDVRVEADLETGRLSDLLECKAMFCESPNNVFRAP
jgi:hypothetical protein